MAGVRGGQLGNHNALKHGMYSDRFKSGEVDDLDTIAKVQNGLEEEINLMRVLIRRVFECADTQAKTKRPAKTDDENQSSQLETWSMALNALGSGSTRLAGLLRVQTLLSAGGGSEVVEALSSALKEVTSELKCK